MGGGGKMRRRPGSARGMAALGAAMGAAGVLALAGGAQASGVGLSAPWYIDQFGGDRADLLAHWAGRTGVVMANAPAAMLFVDWRLLHRQAVGEVAGAALSQPCCDAGGWNRWTAVEDWLKAEAAVTGRPAVEPFELKVDRASGPYEGEPNCFDEAFDLAVQTLHDRAQRYGAASPAVQAWVAAQSAVFAACSDAAAALPPPLPDAPPWLAFDRHYQEAALALYAGRNGEAAERFLAIDREAESPWRYSSLYLAARARVREALQAKTPEALAQAQRAIDTLAAAPAGTFGQGEVTPMRHTIAFHVQPDALFAELGQRLAAPQLGPTTAADLKDYLDLGAARVPPAEVADWIATMKAKPPRLDYAAYADTPEWQARMEADTLAAVEAARVKALAHARARWTGGHDRAWLIAALSLAGPADPGAAELAAHADATPPSDPAWLSAQYHAIRLALGQAVPDPGALRLRLDAILARGDLSVSDRNLFSAQRTQVAADLADFRRFALRARICADVDGSEFFQKPGEVVRCVRWRWEEDSQSAGVYDGEGEKGGTGFGEEARAIIDRMPLSMRLALSADETLPANLRLDVALTSYGRAVGAQDEARIDEAARQLIPLLPLMAEDFRRVLAARPGPDKRLAEFLVLAKDPGIRADLAPNYVRPEGRRIVDFQSHWADWILMPRGADNPPPPPTAYPMFGMLGGWEAVRDDAHADLTCLGECGRGAAPLRLPGFVASRQDEVTAQRSRFLVLEETYIDKPRVYPAGGVAVWDEMLAWCEAHPADPRVPEALHWLVHVGHFGGSHDHSGRRAFMLLHRRYPTSEWAKKTPYYND